MHPDRPAHRISHGLGVLLELSAALAVTAALLIGIEAGARWFLRRTSAEERHEAALADARGDVVETTLLGLPTNPAPLIADPELLWRNQPGAHRQVAADPKVIGRPETWSVATDRSGYRGPDRQAGAEAAQVYRVLCIGDAITYGWGTDQQDIFPRRLEAILTEGYPGATIEVIDAGVPGWSWLQGLRFLETEGLALRPDVVVVGLGTNDQMKDTRSTDLENLGGLTAWSHALFRVRSLLGNTNTFRALELLRHPIPGPSHACRRQIANYGLCHRVSLEEIASAVREVGRVTAANGIDLLLINVDFMRTRALKAERDAAERKHLHLLDFVERFDAARDAREDARSARFGLVPSEHMPSSRKPDGKRRLLLRVHVPGPPAHVRVQGHAYGLADVAFDEPMFDDDTHGDETPHDGVYSTTIEVPARFWATEYTFVRDGESELTPGPGTPSQQAGRLLIGSEDRIAPVEEFGEIYLMADQAHPCRDGHALIAETLAAEIERLPSFRRFVDRIGSSTTTPP
ncbi:MAG TPA: SGNH/GDSL hydrolase family protein [Candidatus Binatia bacterium]|nr:SGNH/GDSL hydrolase family protein [Candidatus Binatia bacterium]